jgi:hypothetical protein
MKVPAIITASIIGFLLGGGAALLAVSIVNPDWIPAKKDSPDSRVAEDGSGGPPGGRGMGDMGGRGRPGPGGERGGRGAGGGRGGPGPGARGPNSSQLAALVITLERLTGKPLIVKLSEEQRAKLREELKGLDEKDELSEEDSKKRVDAILEIIKDDRETLEAAGWTRPPGGGNSEAPPQVPNPFKSDVPGKRLKALQELVSKDESK